MAELSPSGLKTERERPMPFLLASPAFANGQPVPPAYTCRGEDISPPLAWRNPPDGTRSFVLVLEDPDAPSGVFRHWGVYDIPAGQRSLPRGLGVDQLHAATNDFGRPGYGGPCPPPDATHHYRFRLAALNQPALRLPPGATVAALWQAAQPYIIGEADLVGTFRR
jgi:Raf kinase inhibitor-like YbhB/YbcL family protein